MTEILVNVGLAILEMFGGAQGRTVEKAPRPPVVEPAKCQTLDLETRAKLAECRPFVPK